MLDCYLLEGKLFGNVDYKEGNKNNYAKFTLTKGKKTKNKEGKYELDFINCMAWGYVADRANKLEITKGDIVIVRGYMTSSKVNEKLYWTFMVDEVLEVNKANKKSETSAPEGFTEVEDDDVPFL